jgi:hypothetical protein
MDIRETNRANQIPIEKEVQRSVNLIDIDTTIADYMVNTIIPELEENGSPIKVPLIYGNSERWEVAKERVRGVEVVSILSLHGVSWPRG